MKGKARRLLSWVCVLALCMSLLPVTALATQGGAMTGTETDKVSAEANGVTVNKWVSEDEHGNYRLNMEAYASNVVTTESKTTPLDIVLVLDASGSMDDTLSDGGWKYNEVYELNEAEVYYIFYGGAKEVSHDGYGWYYYSWRDKHYVTPKTSAEDTTWNHVQFYTGERVKKVTKWEALETAVDSFLSSVEAQNNAIDGTENGHKVALVKFAGEKTDKIGNGTYKDDDYTYNYTQIVNNLTDNISSVKYSLGNIDPAGATSADYGLEHAQSVLNQSREDAEKVVVFFTDGEPNHGNGFDGSVAKKAIEEANDMKDEGVTIYTVGVFPGASTNITWDDDEDSQMNRYMHAISSNYPDATGYRNQDLGTRATDSNYYFTAENADGLNSVFQQIFEDIHSLQVYPDTDAELTDTLSKYFNFPDGINKENVTAQYVPVNSATGEFDESASKDTIDSVDVAFDSEEDTISITGFDYVENAVTETTEDGETVYSGGKLVVSFPIELDAVACEYKGGTYPTNDIDRSKAGLHYKDKQDDSQNTKSTLLNESPKVKVDASQVERQGTAININVVVDGTPMSEGDVGNYVTVTPSGGQFNENDDTVTYTFTYYDCKDIDFVAKEGYVIEAVDADLVYGQSECKGITDNNGTVTADNVQGGSIVTVYVRTLYTIQYHGADGNAIGQPVLVASGQTSGLQDNVDTAMDQVNNNRPTTQGTFQENGTTYTYVNVCSNQDEHYADNNDDSTCDEHAAATNDGKQQAYDFTYVADLTTSETIDPLPEDKTGALVYDGWFVGNTDTGAQKISEGMNVSNGLDDYNFETMDEADGTADNVINLYCTSSAAQYKVTYKLTSTDNPSDAGTPPADRQYRYDETVSVAANLATQETSNDGVPGTWTFNGWTTNDVTVNDGAFTMPAKDVEFTGHWTFTEANKVKVTYTVTSTENPPSESILGMPTNTEVYVGSDVTAGSAPTTTSTTNGEVQGTWTFSGWSTADNLTNVQEDVNFTGYWTFTPNIHIITVNVTNGTAEADGLSEGTITINDNGSVTITFTGNKGYALDTVTVDKTPAVLTTNEDGSTTYTFSNVKADHNISVVYEEDNIGGENPENPGDGTPDKHQATVTYNVVNGTFGETGPTTKSYVVTTDVYQTTGENAGTWTPLNKHVDDSECPIPTDMTPDSSHVKPGAWEKPEPSNTVLLEGNRTYTYTYTFGTEVEKSLLVTKELTLVGGKEYNKSGIVDEGSELTYTITVTNTGNVTLTDIVVTDTLTINGVEDEVTLGYNGEDSNVTINKDGTATITSLDAKDSVKLTATYTVPEGTAGQKISNTAVATSGDTTGKPENPVEVTVANPSVEITKALTSATRPGDEGFNYDSTTYKAQVGDQLTYTITVNNTGNTHINVVVTDSLWGNGVNTVYIGGDTTGTSVADGDPVTIAMLPKEDSETITYTYTVQASDIGKQNISNTAIASTGTEEDDPKDEDTVTVPMDDYTVTITPANITIYTGGDGYSGVTDGDGNVIPGTETSGLPEPGYHIELPAAVVNWLAEQGVIASGSDADTVAANLSEYLTFTYDYNNQTRNWSMDYAGIYATNEDTGEPTRYVYTLNPANVDGEEIPVRLLYKNGEEVVSTDDILMSETLVSDQFSMTINPGELTQSQIRAKLTVEGQSISCNIDIQPGTLTVRSTTDKDTTTEIVNEQGDVTSNTITAVDGGEVQYYVNDSEVKVDADRVQLLVDEVSNGDAFNAAMGADAITKAGVNSENAVYDLAYMDLVDTQNGNTVVTMGDNQSLFIYWPVPENAAADSEFHVVHYTDMDREDLVSTEDLSGAAHTSPDASVVDVNGEKYVTFETSSFSPFALVYEEAPDPVAKLEVTKTLTKVNDQPYNNGSVSVNDTLTYTITVKNGGVALDNVTITDTFTGKGDLVFNGYTATENPDGTYTIELGNLEANETVTITATYKVLRADASSDLTNAVKVNGTNPGGGENPTDEDKTPETPVNPYRPPIRPPVDPDKPELNTEDHYAYIVGYEDGSVQPEGDITRAEVATIFFRLLTDESRNEYWSQTNPYSDVSADDWFNNAVSTLTNAGVLDGYEDGTFKPNGNITRAEFATITARFFEATYDGENLFPDIEGHWAQDYINEAANAGIVNGYEDGTFRPQQYITRAEAVTMVNRTIERHPDADHLLDDMITWPDNPETAWYYEQIQEATNSHEYTMNTDDEQNPYEIWTKLLPNRDWSELEKEWSDANDGAGSGEVV